MDVDADELYLQSPKTPKKGKTPNKEKKIKKTLELSGDESASHAERKATNKKSKTKSPRQNKKVEEDDMKEKEAVLDDSDESDSSEDIDESSESGISDQLTDRSESPPYSLVSGEEESESSVDTGTSYKITDEDRVKFSGRVKELQDYVNRKNSATKKQQVIQSNN